MKKILMLLILIGTIFAQVVSQGTYSAIVNTSSTLCSDSDSGLNPDVAGHVTLGGQTYNDSCVNQGTIREYYCVNNVVTSTDISCPIGKSCVSSGCTYTFGVTPVSQVINNQSNNTNPALSGNANNTTFIAPLEPTFYVNQTQTSQSGVLSTNNILICGSSILILLVGAGAYMIMRR